MHASVFRSRRSFVFSGVKWSYIINTFLGSDFDLFRNTLILLSEFSDHWSGSILVTTWNTVNFENVIGIKIKVNGVLQSTKQLIAQIFAWFFGPVHKLNVILLRTLLILICKRQSRLGCNLAVF